MKIFVTKTDGTGNVLANVQEALSFSKENNLSYVMIDNGNGCYMRGSFVTPDMAIDFLERML